MGGVLALKRAGLIFTFQCFEQMLISLKKSRVYTCMYTDQNVMTKPALFRANTPPTMDVHVPPPCKVSNITYECILCFTINIWTIQISQATLCTYVTQYYTNFISNFEDKQNHCD